VSESPRPDDRVKSVAHVGFSIVGDEVDPGEWTAATGIAPTAAWKKGEEYRGKPFPDRLMYKRWGVWRVEREAEHMELAARALLAVVEGKVERAKELAESRRLRVVVSLWWEPEGGQGGFDFDAVTMRRLSALCHEIAFYFA